MRILEKSRLVWLSKPKTGSTSIRRLLDPYATVTSQSRRPFYHHNSLSMCIEDMASAGMDWSQFTFVVCERNPFTLIPSLWSYSKINVHYQKVWEPTFDKDAHKMPFDSFIKDERTWDWLRGMHRLQRYTTVAKQEVSIEVFQIENPTPMLQYLNLKIGGDTLPMHLPVDNASQYDVKALGEIRDVMTSDVSIRVLDVFSASFERFDYKNIWLTQ
jgi:hypothetical protein